MESLFKDLTVNYLFVLGQIVESAKLHKNTYVHERGTWNVLLSTNGPGKLIGSIRN